MERDDAERVRLITRTVYWTECYQSWGAAVQLEVREGFLPPSDAVSMTWRRVGAGFACRMR